MLFNIKIPYGIISLGQSCFRNCYNLDLITISDSVMSFGPHCFSGCENLMTITLPKYITILDDYCFANCINLTSIIIPKNVTILSKYCFQNCKKLKSITFTNPRNEPYKIGFNCFNGIAPNPIIRYNKVDTRSNLVNSLKILTGVHNRFNNADAIIIYDSKCISCNIS
jgi:hypothetical protein